jgi:hypothetical protein
LCRCAGDGQRGGGNAQRQCLTTGNVVHASLPVLVPGVDRR